MPKLDVAFETQLLLAEVDIKWLKAQGNKISIGKLLEHLGDPEIVVDNLYFRETDVNRDYDLNGQEIVDDKHNTISVTRSKKVAD